MSDMISRRDVYDALECMRFASDEERQYGFSLLEQIPTAEPDHLAEVSKKDLISRADAIEIVMFECGKWTGLAKEISKQIKQLPSAQPNVQDSVKDADCISRADALSCFHDWIDSHGDVHMADEMPEYQRIEQLPYAQPEIIRCKDCKYYVNIRNIVGGSIGKCEELNKYPHSEWYCGNAERRTDG